MAMNHQNVTTLRRILTALVLFVTIIVARVDPAISDTFSRSCSLLTPRMAPPSSVSPSPGGPPSREDSSVDRIEAEIHRLHDFFVVWFRAEIAKDDDAAFASSLVASMDAGFRLVNPQGISTDRGPLLEALRGAYGCRTGQIFQISCRNVQILHKLPVEREGSATHVYLVSYEEWQLVGETETARLSSVWFEDDPSAPGGLRWLHVHETWMPGMGPPSAQQMWTPDSEAPKDGA